MSNLTRYNDDVVMSTAQRLARDGINYAINNPREVVNRARRFSEAFQSNTGGSGPFGTPLTSRRQSWSGARPGQSKRFGVSRGKSYVGPSKYGGSFVGGKMTKSYKPKKKKPSKKYAMLGKKKRKAKKVTEYACLSKGYHITNQIYGLAQDSDAVYITHSSWHVESMVKVMIGALFRKLIKKMGYNVPNKNFTLPFYAERDAGLVGFVFTVQNQVTGELTSYNRVNTTSSMSFQNLIDAMVDMKVFLIQFLTRTLAGGNPALPTPLMPYSITAYNFTAANDNHDHLVARIDLQNEYFTIPVYSKVRLQNRTLPATANPATDLPLIERSDAQPIKVKIFNFSSGNPRLRFTTEQRVSGDPPAPFQFSNALLGVIHNDGLLLNTAQNLAIPDFQEPPPKNYWSNCTKTFNTVVDPGIIKYSTIKYTYKGTLKNLQAKIRVDYAAGTQSFQKVSGVLGKCQLIVADEYLRTTTSNKIAISYEKELRIGCVVKTKKLPPFTSELQVPGVQNIGS